MTGRRLPPKYPLIVALFAPLAVPVWAADAPIADVPPKFIPARYAKWTFSGGPHFLCLGSNNKLIAGPPTSGALNALNVTGGNGFQVWAVAGVKIEY